MCPTSRAACSSTRSGTPRRPGSGSARAPTRRPTTSPTRAESAATPHPLFEPAWLYPAEAWRATATDPLTHYLARPDRADLSTHPLLPDHAEDWARDAGPDTRLPKTTGRRVTLAEVRAAATAPRSRVDGAVVADVTVVLRVDDGFRRVCWWLRRLYRTEVVKAGTALEMLVVAPDPTDRRIATATALSLPGTRVVAGDPDPAGAVTVVVDPALEPPEWPWLHHLVARLEDPAAGRVGPLLVEQDQTVVAAGALPGPFLRGETPADAARAAHLPVPDLWPGVVAFRTGDGPRDPAYVVPEARVVVPHPLAGPAPAGRRTSRDRRPISGGPRGSRDRAGRCGSSRGSGRCAGPSTSPRRWRHAAGGGVTTRSPGAWPRPWSGAASS